MQVICRTDILNFLIEDRSAHICEKDKSIWSWGKSHLEELGGTIFRVYTDRNIATLHSPEESVYKEDTIIISILEMHIYEAK